MAKLEGPKKGGEDDEPGDFLKRYNAPRIQDEIVSKESSTTIQTPKELVAEKMKSGIRVIGERFRRKNKGASPEEPPLTPTSEPVEPEAPILEKGLDDREGRLVPESSVPEGGGDSSITAVLENLTPESIENSFKNLNPIEVKVQRSSGKIEEGWTVQKIDNEKNVVVTGVDSSGFLRKVVSLEELKKINKETNQEELKKNSEVVEVSAEELGKTTQFVEEIVSQLPSEKLEKKIC